MTPRPDAGSARPPLRIGDLLRNVAQLIDRLDAEVLLAHHLGMERLQMLLHADRPVGVDIAPFMQLVVRRKSGEPVAYITGQREFWSLPFHVSPDVLIPRADSETLIAEALTECAAKPPARILDLGTGSGALLLAALSEWPDAHGVGVDQSLTALAVARRNAANLGLADRVTFQQGDWCDELAKKFDLILANPPYIPAGTPLMIDVAAHEPHEALFAGHDGLDAYRRIFPALPNLLAADGVAIVEFGQHQEKPLAELAAASGFSCRIATDLEQRPRAAICRIK